ncbi:Acyloxyacyl hydrolase, partial [Tupaia chinensis]
GCVLVVSVLEQLAQVHNSTVQATMERLCRYLPEKLFLKTTCYLVIQMFGPDIVKLLTAGMNADVVCHTLEFCKQDAGQPLCHLYAPPKEPWRQTLEKARQLVEKSPALKRPRSGSDICSLPFLAKICQEIKLAIQNSVPFKDADSDKYSVFSALRGYHWRGRDCNDSDATVYPGRRPDNWDAHRDSNCNGIWGVDPSDGIPYEKKFCEGASSQNLKQFIESLSRSKLWDHPAVVIYAMIGNDVCNGKRDPVPAMTTPEKLYSHVMQTLQQLHSHLPNGSSVIFYGLPDGTFLWDNLHSRYHPLGQLNRDVTYAQLYAFLNCLQVSPCHGWMSSNKTLRALTSERAKQLSKTLERIADSERFTNLNLFYMDFAFQEITEEWRKRGGQPWQLIEPVDGFHPNEVASLLLADHFWRKVQLQWPQVLGKENPFNPQIEKVFGDQGGH